MLRHTEEDYICWYLRYIEIPQRKIELLIDKILNLSQKQHFHFMNSMNGPVGHIRAIFIDDLFEI